VRSTAGRFLGGWQHYHATCAVTPAVPCCPAR
jgi:hypothetical protein